MTHIDSLTKEAFDALCATSARSDAQVASEARRGPDMRFLILLGCALVAWSFLWPAIMLDEEGVLTLNSITAGAGMLVAVLALAFHSPGIIMVPAKDLEVSPLLIGEVFSLADAFPEAAPTVNAWVASGHPIRRGQLRVLEEYVHLRRAQVSSHRLRASHPSAVGQAVP